MFYKIILGYLGSGLVLLGIAQIIDYLRGRNPDWESMASEFRSSVQDEGPLFATVTLILAMVFFLVAWPFLFYDIARRRSR